MNQKVHHLVEGKSFNQTESNQHSAATTGLTKEAMMLLAHAIWIGLFGTFLAATAIGGFLKAHLDNRRKLKRTQLSFSYL